MGFFLPQAPFLCLCRSSRCCHVLGGVPWPRLHQQNRLRWHRRGRSRHCRDTARPCHSLLPYKPPATSVSCSSALLPPRPTGQADLSATSSFLPFAPTRLNSSHLPLASHPLPFSITELFHLPLPAAATDSRLPYSRPQG